MKYIRPVMDITKFSGENVVAVSGGFNDIIDDAKTAYSESVSYSELSGVMSLKK